MARKKATRAVKLLGTEIPAGKQRELAAGDLTATFDSGAIRHVRYRGIEILRGISFLVRDKSWGTYSPTIKELKIQQRPDGFAIKYNATCRDGDQEIAYEASIAADASGWLIFFATATPVTDFVTNRTGFVVLHPLEGVAGKPVQVVHADGSREKGAFPKLISPGQPIFDIRSLKHTVVPGVSATVSMEGDKFEMEDHRNWTDASYKTYIRPLRNPWPYTLKKGKPFTQSVALRIEGKPKQRLARHAGNVVEITVGAPQNRIPALGSGVPMKEAKAALLKSDLIAAAGLAHLVCQIDGREKGLAEAAASFRELKDRTGIPISLEIILPARDTATKEADEIAAAVRDGGLQPDAVVITQAYDLKSFQPGTPHPGPNYAELASAARSAFPGIRIGGGMLSYFTELNRKRPPQGLFDFITHTACPLVHSADDVSVIETLESLPWIFASTRAIIGKTPYHMGPTGIACRDNPYGATSAPNPNNDRVCLADMDPRQRGLFGAAWNLGFIAEAARAGLDAIALGAVTGPQGAIYVKGSQWQPWFDDNSAPVYPVYHILAGLAPASGARRYETISPKPSAIAALAYESQSGPVTWLANLTAATQQVKVKGMKGNVLMHVLDDQSFESSAQDPKFLAKDGARLKRLSTLELGPYAVARIATA